MKGINKIYQFGSFVLDAGRQRLFRDGKVINVDLRVIDLLVCLIEAAPNWVDKNDLLDRLWPDQEITEWALSRLVSDTRKLLGDDGEKQRIIRTIRGRGFQFCEDFKLLPPSGISISADGTRADISPAAGTGLFKYFLAGVAMLTALAAGVNYFFTSPAEKKDITALVNLSSSGQFPLDDILGDWALSHDDMALIKEKKHPPGTDTAGLFEHYCGDGACNQLITIMIRKNNNALSLRYLVISDGLREEERQLISTSRSFLLSALRDAVANTMNRPSDFFTLPRAIFMQHPDRLFQDMYRLHINLQNTYVTFLAQARRRNELVALITERLHITRKTQYEKFFITYYDQMNKEERFIFDQIRAMTSGTLYQGNRNMLTLLETNPSLAREIPKLDDVRKHLAFWVNKYHNIFLGRDDMCLLYVGVEDAVPFPSGVDQEVSDWLRVHQPEL